MLLPSLASFFKTVFRKPRYIRALRSAFDRFNEPFGTRPVHSISAPEIETWLNSAKSWPNSERESLKAKELSPLTRCNYLRDLKILFRYCVKRKYCVENPISEIEKPKVPESEIQILSIGQIVTLLLTANGRTKGKDRDGKEISISLIPYLALGLFAGLRSSEIEMMDWNQINLYQRKVEVTAGIAKTSRRRLVEISDNLYTWLKPYEKLHGGPVMFEGWRDRLQKLAKAAGFDEWPKNALRHSFASYHYAKHKNLQFTVSQTGHSERVFHGHYKQLISDAEANCFWHIFPPRPNAKWMMEAPREVMTKKEIEERLREADSESLPRKITLHVRKKRDSGPTLREEKAVA